MKYLIMKNIVWISIVTVSLDLIFHVSSVRSNNLDQVNYIWLHKTTLHNMCNL